MISFAIGQCFYLVVHWNSQAFIRGALWTARGWVCWPCMPKNWCVITAWDARIAGEIALLVLGQLPEGLRCGIGCFCSRIWLELLSAEVMLGTGCLCNQFLSWITINKYRKGRYWI